MTSTMGATSPERRRAAEAERELIVAIDDRAPEAEQRKAAAAYLKALVDFAVSADGRRSQNGWEATAFWQPAELREWSWVTL
jgi:hypothetical protein